MAIDTQVKVSGVWRRVKAIWTKQSGVWKPVDATHNKVSGIWKKTFRRRYRYLRMYVDAGNFLWITDLSYRMFGTEYPVPNMTSNTTPVPLVVSASSEAQPAWYAFDGLGNFWIPNSPAIDEWITIDFGSGNGVAPDQFTVSDANGSVTVDVTIQGSDDNSTWNDLGVGSWTGAGTYVISLP